LEHHRRHPQNFEIPERTVIAKSNEASPRCRNSTPRWKT
jgi:hypothetical protein